jgi:hypothetical protein
MAVAAACRATAISPTVGSHRSAMLCLTTRSRAPLQGPKCGGDRQTDEMRSVSQAGRKLRLCRQSYPKPTYSNVAGQVAFIDPRPRVQLAPAGVLAQTCVWGVASETPSRRCSFPGSAAGFRHRRCCGGCSGSRPEIPRDRDCCCVALPPGGKRMRRLARFGVPTSPKRRLLPALRTARHRNRPLRSKSQSEFDERIKAVHRALALISVKDLRLLFVSYL